MASTVYHNIVIEAANPLGVVRLEGIASAALTPGELVRFDGNAELEPHGGAGAVLVGKLVVLESQTPDDEDSATIDADYAADDTTYYAQAQPGDVMYMFLAVGETAVRGVSQLESDGAGALQVVVIAAGTLAGSTVGVADEAVGLVAGARARIRVRIT